MVGDRNPGRASAETVRAVVAAASVGVASARTRPDSCGHAPRRRGRRVRISSVHRLGSDPLPRIRSHDRRHTPRL